MATTFSITFKNGKKQDYTLSSDLSRDYTSADQLANGNFTEAAIYLLTQYDRNGKEVGKLLFRYAGSRGGVQLVDVETGVYSAVYSLKDFAAGIPVFDNQGKVVTTPAQEVAPTAPPPPPPVEAKPPIALYVGGALLLAFLLFRK